MGLGPWHMLVGSHIVTFRDRSSCQGQTLRYGDEETKPDAGDPVAVRPQCWSQGEVTHMVQE